MKDRIKELEDENTKLLAEVAVCKELLDDVYDMALDWSNHFKATFNHPRNQAEIKANEAILKRIQEATVITPNKKADAILELIGLIKKKINDAKFETNSKLKLWDSIYSLGFIEVREIEDALAKLEGAE